MENTTTNIDSDRTVVIASSKSGNNIAIENFLSREGGFLVRRTDEAVVLWSWIERGLGDCIITDVKFLDENIIQFFSLLKKFYRNTPPGIILISENNLYDSKIKNMLTDQHDVLFLTEPLNLENILNEIKTLLNVDNASTNSDIEVFNAERNVAYESLSVAVERHLSNYFKAHDGDLPSSGLYERVLQEVERPLIKVSLLATGGNQLQAAKILGLNRNTLRKKIRDLNLEVVRGLRQSFDRTK